MSYLFRFEFEQFTLCSKKRSEVSDHTRTFRMSMGFDRVENMTYLDWELYQHTQMQEQLGSCEETIENHHHKYSKALEL